MKNYGLPRSLFVLSILLFCTQAFADEAEKPEEDADLALPVAKSEPGKAGNPRRSPRATSWCSVHSKLDYMTGGFSGSSRADSFVRDGARLGASCSYNNNSRLSIGLGGEFYLGKFHLNHAEEALEASVSFLEFGHKEWLSATLDLRPIKIVAVAGVESTGSSRFKVDSLQVDLGTGPLDLTDYGAEHLSVDKADLVIVEAGLNVEFPFRRNFSLTFGGLWQRYDVSVRVKLDAEGKRVLEALNYDVNKVDRDFERSRNFFYLTPGLRWRRGDWAFTGDIFWGTFSTQEGSSGVRLGVERRF
jgi:hypothetical protein